MLTYLIYADHMLEIVKILVEIPEIAREFQPPKPLYSDPSVYRELKRAKSISLYRGLTCTRNTYIDTEDPVKSMENSVVPL
jgi:hypothetical protein